MSYDCLFLSWIPRHNQISTSIHSPEQHIIYRTRLFNCSVIFSGTDFGNVLPILSTECQHKVRHTTRGVTSRHPSWWSMWGGSGIELKRLYQAQGDLNGLKKYFITQNGGQTTLQNWLLCLHSPQIRMPRWPKLPVVGKDLLARKKCFLWHDLLRQMVCDR